MLRLLEGHLQPRRRVPVLARRAGHLPGLAGADAAPLWPIVRSSRLERCFSTSERTRSAPRQYVNRLRAVFGIRARMVFIFSLPLWLFLRTTSAPRRPKEQVSASTTRGASARAEMRASFLTTLSRSRHSTGRGQPARPRLVGRLRVRIATPQRYPAALVLPGPTPSGPHHTRGFPLLLQTVGPKAAASASRL